MTYEEAGKRIKEIAENQFAAPQPGGAGPCVEIDGYFSADDLRKIASVLDEIEG